MHDLSQKSPGIRSQIPGVGVLFQELRHSRSTQGKGVSKASRAPMLDGEQTIRRLTNRPLEPKPWKKLLEGSPDTARKRAEGKGVGLTNQQPQSEGTKQVGASGTALEEAAEAAMTADTPVLRSQKDTIVAEQSNHKQQPLRGPQLGQHSQEGLAQS